jgi:integrase
LELGAYGPPGRELDLSDLVRFMAGVGCRVGEAIALSWTDVSTDFMKVTFRATAVRVTGQGLVRQPHGKTDSSARTITVPAQVASILRDRYHARDSSATLVFPTVRGRLRDPQNTKRDWRLARERLDLGDVNLHAFRKTVATAQGCQQGISRSTWAIRILR